MREKHTTATIDQGNGTGNGARLALLSARANLQRRQSQLRRLQ